MLNTRLVCFKKINHGGGVGEKGANSKQKNPQAKRMALRIGRTGETAEPPEAHFETGVFVSQYHQEVTKQTKR